MVRRKQLVLITSMDRTESSASTSDFTVRLTRPIDNVIRTDLRQVIIGSSYQQQPTSNSFIGIQSTQLGNRISSGGDIAMYDVIPYGAPPFVYERYSTITQLDESMYERPVMLYQIDLRFVNPDGTTADFSGTDVALLLEVITEDK